jgi:hypothetical protein
MLPRSTKVPMAVPPGKFCSRRFAVMLAVEFVAPHG